ATVQGARLGGALRLRVIEVARFARIVFQIEQLEGVVVAVVNQLEAVLSDDHVFLAVRHQILFRRQVRRIFFGRLLGVDGRVRESFAAQQRQQADAGIIFRVIQPDGV